MLPPPVERQCAFNNNQNDFTNIFYQEEYNNQNNLNVNEEVNLNYEILYRN